jgi:membrane protein YdbS with pleckstrin-like domain
MSATKSKLRDPIIGIACLIVGIVLLLGGIFFAIGSWQKDIVPGFVIVMALSLVLLIIGAVFLIRYSREDVAEDQTKKDKQNE